MHERLTGACELGHGAKNYAQANSASVPVQIFRARRRLHRQQNFDCFL